MIDFEEILVTTNNLKEYIIDYSIIVHCQYAEIKVIIFRLYIYIYIHTHTNRYIHALKFIKIFSQFVYTAIKAKIQQERYI